MYDPFLSATDETRSSMRRNARMLLFVSIGFAAVGVAISYQGKMSTAQMAMNFAEVCLWTAVGGQVGQKGIEKFSAALGNKSDSDKTAPRLPKT